MSSGKDVCLVLGLPYSMSMPVLANLSQKIFIRLLDKGNQVDAEEGAVSNASWPRLARFLNDLDMYTSRSVHSI